MKRKWKIATVCVVALMLLSTLGMACGGDDDEEGEAIITVGYVTDLTGPAATACIPAAWAFNDWAKHINEEDPIPGVEIDVLVFDARYDPSRSIPGYDWLTERGAKVMFTVLDTFAEVVKPFAERDAMPIGYGSATLPCLEPPGWVFCTHPATSWEVAAIVKWIGDQWRAEGKYDTVGKPKIGTVGWSGAYGNDVKEGAEYALRHPDDFDYIGSYMAPMGVLTWSGEIEKLKNCDYIVVTGPGGLQPATFIDEFRARGYTALMVGSSGFSAFTGMLTDKCGWEAMDGTLSGSLTLWWDEPYANVDLVKDILHANHSSAEAEEAIHSGTAYLASMMDAVLFFEIMREAIEEVGAENFDGQAFYDTAIEFELSLEGYPALGFGENRRYAAQYVKIYEFDAEARDLESVGDWVPIEKS